MDLELTIRGIYTPDQATNSLYYNQTYVEEAVSYLKGQTGFFTILAKTPQDVPKIRPAVDEMFRNSPQPTKTETEKAFQLGFVAMLGNVKAFILSICMAVVFAILLVSANTMAMSIRERTREVAVLKTLGFTRRTILSLFVGEAVTLALVGGVLGSLGWLPARRRRRQGGRRIFRRCAESSSRDHVGGLGGGGAGRFLERDGAFLQRFADWHRGGLAPHRLRTVLRNYDSERFCGEKRLWQQAP